MTFEWDERKNEINKKKHKGISFEYAAHVFEDSKRIERFDALHSMLNEERMQTIGMVQEVLFVVYTEKGEDIVRIISARIAEKEEVDEYYQNYDAR